MENSDIARVFFALWPEKATAQRLLQWAPQGIEGHPLTADALHLTLAFIGRIDNEQLEQLIEFGGTLPFPAFSLIIDRLCYWPYNRTLWAGIAPAEELSVGTDLLRQKLSSNKFRFETRQLKPHIALIRNAQQVPRLPAPDPIVWPITSWCLAASQRSAIEGEGSRYEILASWPTVRAR